MTTYTLRKGSPAKTRTDLVVIGVAKTGKGDLVACPGAEDVASEYGRKFKPMLSSMGFHGGAGEVLRVPTGGAIKAGQLLVVGLGDRDSLTLERVRRAAGVAARNVGNAASVALALPAHDAEHVRAVADGFLLGHLLLQSVQVEGRRRRCRGRLHPQRHRPPPGRDHVAGDRQDRRGGRRSCARLGEHAAQRPDPRALRRRRAVLRQAAHRPLQAEARDRGPGTRGAGRARLRRDPRCRDGLVEPAPPGQAELGPRGRAGEGRVRRQGRHLRLGRPDHQARQLDGDDEVRHGWRGGSDRGDLRDRRARAARGRDHLRADGGEHGLRHCDATRRRADDVQRARPSRSPTPMPRDA